MIEKRMNTLLIFFVVIGIVALYFLFDRMIGEKEKYFHARYTDSAFVELMEGLTADGVFKADNNSVIIDENALRQEHLGDKTIKRIKESLSSLYIKDNKVYFDSLSASITNNRIFMDERVSRGNIFDRNGVVIVKSAIDERTWRQERQYVDGPVFYPVVGHFNPVYGMRNLEKVMDTYLSGKNHLPVYRKTSDPLRKLQLGDDVNLTLDFNLQKRAYELMNNKKGAVVVIDVKTGEILAAVSTPSFDPNERSRDVWRDTFADNLNRPYENRAFSVPYPPGSTFKTVVASVWLEMDGKDDFKKDHSVVCTGRKNRYNISDIHVHGRVDIDKAYADSCNIYFSEIGVILGQDMMEYAGKFGFNKMIDLIPEIDSVKYDSAVSKAFLWDDPGEAKPFSTIDFKRNPKIIAQGAIGQNTISATPLQMAMIAATVANRGVMMNPYIIKEIKTGDGKKVVFSSKPVETGRAIKEKTAMELRRMMEEVMRTGTGKDVKKIYFENGKYIINNNPHFGKVGQGGLSEGKLIKVAGKTGTAEIGDRNGNGQNDADEKPHSWFIGFAPADNPKIAIAVIAENQGFGSLTAAPIAMDVLAEAMNQLLQK